MPVPINRTSVIKTLEDKTSDNRTSVQNDVLIQKGRIHKYTDKEFEVKSVEDRWKRKRPISVDTFQTQLVQIYVPPIPEYLLNVTEFTSSTRVSFLFGGLSNIEPFVESAFSSIYFYTGSCITNVITNSAPPEYARLSIEFCSGTITSPVINQTNFNTGSTNTRFYTGSIYQVISSSYMSDTASYSTSFISGTIFNEMLIIRSNDTGSVLVGFYNGTLTNI